MEDAGEGDLTPWFSAYLLNGISSTNFLVASREEELSFSFLVLIIRM